MEPNGQCEQHFGTDLHVSAAVLDVESLPPNSKKGVQCWVEYGGKSNLITNLSRAIPQFSLDIGFSKGETVIFHTKGQGNVYLHGYFVSDGDDENDNV